MNNSKNMFIEELKFEMPSFLISKWILDRIPFLFEENHISCIKWRERLSNKIGVDSKSIVFSGSSTTGFSLNPSKNFRDFDAQSDIDISIISEHHFDISWHCLRNLGTKRYQLSQKQKNAVKDHVERLIYWGTIATDKILEILPFGKEWVLALSEMSRIEPTLDRTINARIYKDFESLRKYFITNVNKIKKNLDDINRGDDEQILKHDP